MPDSPNKPNQQGPEPLPEFIAHYRILQRLGKGGMGEVFLAEDTKQHGRKVALKVLLRSLTNEPNRIRRFKQEAPRRVGAQSPEHSNYPTEIRRMERQPVQSLLNTRGRNAAGVSLEFAT
jgi:serine/threonine protein kinase